MAIAVGYVIALLGVIAAVRLSKGKTNKRKYIVWGITLMLAISPFLSFSIGLSFAIIVRNPWAGLIMWYLFPIIFIVGLILLLMGLFKKKETKAI